MEEKNELKTIDITIWIVLLTSNLSTVCVLTVVCVDRLAIYRSVMAEYVCIGCFSMPSKRMAKHLICLVQSVDH